VTLALNLVLPDLPRAALLLWSVTRFLDPTAVHTLLIIVPDAEHAPLSTLLSPSLGGWGSVPVVVLRESELLGSERPPQWDSYATQMALKLLVARKVETPWYLTLDADVLLARPLTAADLVMQGRAVYVDERCALRWGDVADGDGW
jgi:hypothetical protein